MNWVYGQRALVAVLSAAALLVAGCSGSAGGESEGGGKPPGERVSRAQPPGTPGRAGPEPPRIPSAKGLPGWSHAPGFAADGSGFALLAECPQDEGSTRGCVQRVAVLRPGADAWRLTPSSPLRETAPDDGVTADLLALGKDRALIREGSQLVGDRTWFTRDGGRTWRAGTTSARRTIAAAPEGARLTSVCTRVDDEGNGCARSRLAVIMPDTGEYRALAHQPPLKGEVFPVEGAEPDLYAQGKAGSGDGFALMVSWDRGRSWKETQMTGASAEPHGTFSIVSGRAGTFALQHGMLPEEEGVKNGLLTIHRMDGSGLTWTRVWAFKPGVEPRSTLGAVSAGDMTLTVYGENGVWTSDTGGRTFHRGEGPTGIAGSVRETPIGWLWTSSYGQGTYRISTDGVRWHSFQLGS
ncbi:exo-alpha-sialidase [Streptomyces sp. NPDC050418]|uniref:exo-alpha-sialidase n=1 Tax=Streptomyces sp. NPDC050418 TaxID=3365612 RepID=UPI0037AEF42A